MRFNILYFDNDILLSDDKIFSLEIENKKYFYRLVMDLYNVANGNLVDDIKFFDNESKEINLSSKLNIIVDYFDFEANFKKYINGLQKYIVSCINDKEKDEIIKISNKLFSHYNKILNNIDLPLSIHLDSNVETITKMLKINVDVSNEVLNNILLLIDLEKNLRLNKVLIFINLKQFITKEELEELYKYSIYNQVNIMLIDSQSYGVTIKHESKLIIDNNLDEFML